MTFPARRIQAVYSSDGVGIPSLAHVPFSFHRLGGPTSFTVPNNFVLVLTTFHSTTIGGVVFFEVVTRPKNYYLQLNGFQRPLVPPIVVRSGDEVVINLFNPGPDLELDGNTIAYAVHGILVPADYRVQGSIIPSKPRYYPPLV